MILHEDAACLCGVTDCNKAYSHMNISRIFICLYMRSCLRKKAFFLPPPLFCLGKYHSFVDSQKIYAFFTVSSFVFYTWRNMHAHETEEFLCRKLSWQLDAKVLSAGCSAEHEDLITCGIPKWMGSDLHAPPSWAALVVAHCSDFNAFDTTVCSRT